MPNGFNTGRPDIGMSRGQPDFEDATNMESSFSNYNEKRPKRPEMRGPADLKDILSGLKTKTIQVNDGKPESVASIKEIEELSKDTFKKPKKSRRKKSEKNVLNLNM